MQMLLIIFAGLLLQILILNESKVNNNMVETIGNNYVAEQAISLAEQCLLRFTGKRLVFDEYLTSNSVSPSESAKSSSLTTDAYLGRDASESASNSDTFDDIDDYNKFDTLIVTEPAKKYGFRVKCSVKYFDPSAGTTTTSRTWHKMITVFISDSTKGSNYHSLVDVNGKKLVLQKYIIKSFFNIIN